MSTASQSSPPADIVKDIFLWRRKKLSITVLFVATATWVLLEVYQFNFITVASWVAMFTFTFTFLWGNILRLLNKETPDMSGLEITEETAMEIANSLRAWSEEGVRWMFRVGAESELFVFARTVAGLLLLSYLGSFCDLLTLLYIGTVVGMTVPVIYVKYEDKIKGYGERLRVQCKRFCGMIDEKVFRKLKNKVVGEKKIE
uniref:Reticulon-like protein n=1 Tax=Davidia involucrata TaxID=16924 RepID=A0A5B7BAZ5_DAVIN